MNKVHWEYWWARRFSASRYEIVMKVFFSDFYRKEFGVRLPNTMIAPVAGNHAIYIDSSEWTEFSQAVYQRACSDLVSFNRYYKMIQHDQQVFLEVCRKIGSEVSNKASQQQMQEWYDEYIAVYQDFFNTAIWIPFTTEPLVSEKAQSKLEELLQKKGLNDQYSKFFDAIFLPEDKNAITREREDLLSIVADSEKLSTTTLELRLQQHTDKYQWIPCYDIYDQPWTIDYFTRSYQDTKKDDWRQELTSIRLFEERANNFKRSLVDLGCDPESKVLFEIAHRTVFIKDERDDYRRQGSYSIQPFFSELGRRMGGLDLQEVANLLIDEVTAFLKTGQLPDIKQIRERVDGYVLLRKNDDNQIIIYSGETANEIINRELGHLELEKKTEITGVCGAAGSVKGNARVVTTKHDLRKIVKGDIMVAVTTHPDFVPAMRQCKAIVTDEGGLTCHAAIVSRELEVPCIVGTKKATSLINDGDEIYVDADRGIVKIKPLKKDEISGKKEKRGSGTGSHQ